MFVGEARLGQCSPGRLVARGAPADGHQARIKHIVSHPRDDVGAVALAAFGFRDEHAEIHGVLVRVDADPGPASYNRSAAFQNVEPVCCNQVLDFLRAAKEV